MARSPSVASPCGVTRLLGSGRIRLTSFSAEWALRLYRLRRKLWFFVGFDHSREGASVIYTLIRHLDSAICRQSRKKMNPINKLVTDAG